MYSTIRKIVKSIKSLGLMALMFLFAAASLAAPSAMASRMSAPSGELGVLNLTVAYDQGTATSYATAVIFDQYGQAVKKMSIPANTSVSVKLADGIYKVRVSAQDYVTTTEQVKISPHDTTYAKIELYKSPTPR